MGLCVLGWWARRDRGEWKPGILATTSLAPSAYNDSRYRSLTIAVGLSEKSNSPLITVC